MAIPLTLAGRFAPHLFTAAMSYIYCYSNSASSSGLTCSRCFKNSFCSMASHCWFGYWSCTRYVSYCDDREQCSADCSTSHGYHSMEDRVTCRRFVATVKQKQ